MSLLSLHELESKKKKINISSTSCNPFCDIGILVQVDALNFFDLNTLEDEVLLNVIIIKIIIECLHVKE
jgi:hypothetical protein